jgi:hypothetical protein
MDDAVIGRVLRASTRGFSCGTHSTRIGPHHDFGAFVRAPVANDPSQWVIGLVTAVEIKDDMMVTELVMAEWVNPNVLRDQRENRMIPVEISVLNIGFQTGSTYFQSLPPRPPMSLSEVVPCTRSEVCAFTERLDFARVVLGASEVPSDDLLGAALRGALLCRPPDERPDFRVTAGRHLAKLLTSDLRRLSQVLALLSA